MPYIDIPIELTCTECGRVFDLTNPEESEEAAYGHDCEEVPA